MIKHNKHIGEYLTAGKHVHLVGIGGVSMRPLGLVLKGMGMLVTGSDMNASVSTDELISKGIEVIVLPNLYGDIVTDVAAEHQGGLGTACSSNIGNKYAMFEAIHGTAPYLMSHGRGHHADPCSLIRAVGMMLAHIGYADRKEKLDRALHICTVTERKKVVTTFVEDASTKEFTDYLIKTIEG